MAVQTSLARILRRRRAATAPDVAALAACDLFVDLPDLALAELAAGALRLSLEPGQPVVHEGDPADAVYVVLDGRLTVTAEPGAAAIPDLVAGDYFGEIGVLGRAPRTATVTTSVTTTLLRLDGPVFRAALARGRPSPSLLGRIRSRLARTSDAGRAGPGR